MKTKLSHNMHGVILVSIVVLVMLSVMLLLSAIQPVVAQSRTLPIASKLDFGTLGHFGPNYIDTIS